MSLSRTPIGSPSFRLQCGPGVAIEAGARIGWERYTGLDGAIIGMDGYGASAPGATNMKEFGFTAENVAETGRRVLEDRI